MSARTIYKYDVPVDDQVHQIGMPRGATILHVACQNSADTVQIWVECLPSAPPEIRSFIVYGTGHAVHESGVYHGTCLAADGALVWHLYEVVQ